MASDDQQRNAAGNGHAVELKPEFRALAERAKELAKREERRRTEQVKADTQRKAEISKGGGTADRRKPPTRRKKTRGTPAGVHPKRGRAAHPGWQGRRRKGACATAIQPRRRKTGTRPRRSPQSRTRDSALAADIRRRAEAAVAERQQRQKAQQQEEQRRQTDHVRTLHRDEMHSFKENEDTAIAIHSRQIQSIDEREKGRWKRLAHTVKA